MILHSSVLQVNIVMLLYPASMYLSISEFKRAIVSSLVEQKPISGRSPITASGYNFGALFEPKSRRDVRAIFSVFLQFL